MTAAVTILFDGLAYAVLLFIISVGLSITMGLMGFVNLAHGAFAMVGGYATVTLMNDLGVPFLPALGIAFLVAGGLSVPIERLVYRPLYDKDELDQVLLTIGLVFMATAVITFAYGPAPPVISVPSFLTGQVDLGFRTVPAYRLFTIVFGIVLIAILWLGLERTLIGAKIRAAVDNRRMAQSVGIDVNRLFALTFALGSGLAGVGGGLAIEIVGISPVFAIQYLVFFLIVVAAGGLGSVLGAFIAAVVLGLVDTAGKYLWPEGGAFFIFVATIALLLARPDGLFGKQHSR